MKFLGYDVKHNSVPLFISEISCSHGGSLDNACKLIEESKRAHADIIKIQVYHPDEMVYSKPQKVLKGQWKGRDLYELYKKNQMPFEWLETLFKCAFYADIPIFASVFGKKSLAALEKIQCQAYKIASFEANDYPLIEQVIKTKKPIMISTGCSSFNDIQKLDIDLFPTDYPRIYMHCVSKYPCYDHDANLNRIKQLKGILNETQVGYSDHTKGYATACIAAAIGAKYIEKHFHNPKLCKSDDSKFSLTSLQFKNMVEKVRKTHEMCGSFGDTKEHAQSEFKRSIWAVKNIKIGEEFTEDNIKTLRPFRGLDARLYNKTIGKNSNTFIPAGTPLELHYISGAK